MENSFHVTKWGSTCTRFISKLLQFATLEKPVEQTVLKMAVLKHDGAETNPHN
jgi:hypothetical protein